MKIKLQLILTTLLLALFLVIVPDAYAADCIWTEGAGADKTANTIANWTDCGGGVPGDGDSATINSTSTAITWDIARVESLTLGSAYTGTTTLANALTSDDDITLSGGTLDTDTYNLAVGNGSGDSGNLTVASGAKLTHGGGGIIEIKMTGTLGGAGITEVYILSVSGTQPVVTMGGDVTTASDCNVTAGNTNNVTFDMDTYDLTVGNDLLIRINQNNLFNNANFYAGSGTLTIGNDLNVIALATTWASQIARFWGETGNTTVAGDVLVQNGATYFGQSATSAIFDAGTSGTLDITGKVTVYNTCNHGVATRCPTEFDGNGKNIVIGGTLDVYTDDTSDISFTAGDSGTITVNGLTHIYNQSTNSGSAITFEGESKNLEFFGGLTVELSGATAGDLTFTPSTGTNDINGVFTFSDSTSATANASISWADPGSEYTMTASSTFTATDDDDDATFSWDAGSGTITLDDNDADQTLTSDGISFYNLTHTGAGKLTLADATTITGDLTNSAGNLVVNGLTTVTGDITNTSTIEENSSYIVKGGTSIALDKSSYDTESDTTLSVTLIDQDENLVGTTTDSSIGSVLSVTGGDVENVTLTESGDATYTFTATINLAESAGHTEQNGILEIPEDSTDTITVAYTDDEDSTDSALSDTATVEVEGYTAPVTDDSTDDSTTTTGSGAPVDSIGGSGGTGLPSLSGSYSPPTTSPPPTTTTPTIPPTTSTPTLTQTYSPNTTNPEVKTLQQFLNSQGFQLATTGPGSPGSETNYFGRLTRTALQSFQCHHQIVCEGTPETTGYGRLGPKTKAKINELNQTPQTQTPQQQILNLQKLVEVLQEQTEQLQNLYTFHFTRTEVQ